MATTATRPVGGLSALPAARLLARHESAARASSRNPIARWLVRRRGEARLLASASEGRPGDRPVSVTAVSAATHYAKAVGALRAVTGLGFFTRLQARSASAPAAGGSVRAVNGDRRTVRDVDSLERAIAAAVADAADLAGVPTAPGLRPRAGLIDQLRLARIAPAAPLAQGEGTDPDSQVRALAARIRALGAQGVAWAEAIRRLAETEYGAPRPIRGTVTDRAVPGTAHVANGRRGKLAPATVRSAVASLVGSDFGGGVSGVRWEGNVLVVQTRRRGAQHFLVGVDSLSRDRLAQTRVRTGLSTDPHRTTIGERVADNQVARAVLHEISHTFNAMDSAERRAGRSTVRRALFGINPMARAAAHRDDCVAARFNEHRYLSRLWRAAWQRDPESDGLTALAHEIAGLVGVIEEHGRIPPPAPWEGGVHQSVPRLPAFVASSGQSGQFATDLQNAATDLQPFIDSHVDSARKADAAAAKADEAADKAHEQEDRSKADRERRARAVADLERANSARHTRIAENYRAAQARAEEARETYLETAPAIAEFMAAHTAGLSSGAPSATGRPSRSAAEVADLAANAQRAAAAYRSALADAVPGPDVLPSGMPTGRLPHLAKLTLVVNEALKSKGVDHQYTAEDLQSEIRAEFRRVAGKDGAVLRVGAGTPAELRISLDTSETVEVLDPAVKAAQLMLGGLPQGGQSTSAVANRTFGPSGTLTPTRLLRYLPRDLHPAVDAVRTAARFVSFGFSGGRTRAESTTGGASGFALSGGVQDNRGESSLYDAAAVWRVQVRTKADANAERSGWSEEQEVGTGTEDDASRLRFWLSHAYTAGSPEETTRLLPRERQRTPLPHHAVLGETGHEALAEKLLGEMGHDQAPIGSVTRDQIRAVLTEELPGLLGQSTDTGILRVLSDDAGRPAYYMQVDSEVVLEPTPEHPDAPEATMVGEPSTKELLEELRVGFSGTSGSTSASRSWNLGLVGGLNARVDNLGRLPGVDEIPGADDVFDESTQAVGLKSQASAGMSRARAAGAAVSSMSIHPSVQRYSGHTQGYRLRVVHRVRLTPFDQTKAATTVRGDADVFVRMPESEAYRYGLPVDKAAIELDENGDPKKRKDGSLVLRGDLNPDPPPGRKGEPPEWWSKVRGVGHGLVREFEGVLEARKDVLEKLADEGLVPRLKDGDPVRTTDDDREWESQLANLREVMEQLSVARLETGYDQAAQTGLVVDLVRNRPGHPSEHVTMRMQLIQNQAEYEGHTPAHTMVGLDIGSNTSTRSGGSTRGHTVAGMLGVGLNLGEDTDPAKPGARTNNIVSGSRTKKVGAGQGSEWSDGDTVNGVTLVEGESSAQFKIGHALAVDLVEANGKTRQLTRKAGSARVLVPSDWLPESGTPHAAEAGDTPEEVLQRLTVLQADLGDPLAEIEKKLTHAVDPSSPAYHHLVEHLSVDGIRSHMVELLQHGYRTELAVSPQGLSPSTATVAVTTKVGQSRFITASDMLVADINFTMGSHGTTFSESKTSGHERSLGGGVGQVSENPAGGSIGWSRAQNTSTSRRQTKIWGRERLTVETGKQYIYEMSVDLQIAAKERGVTLEPVSLGDRTVVYSVPERDALELYAQGKLDVPVTQVADAVQRYVQGDLLLDHSIASRLVRHYLKDRHAAGPDFLADNEVAGKHTIEKLVERVNKDFPLTDAPRANESVARQLARHLIAADKPQPVDLPEHLQNNVGQSAFEQVSLSTEDGKNAYMFDQVLAAVQNAVPGADNDPVLWQRIFNDLAGKRWWGKMDNMLDPNGFTATYPVRDGIGVGASSTSNVRVRIKAELVDDATMLGETDDLVQIIQDYNYVGAETNRSSGTSVGASITSSHGGGHVGDGTLGTDHTRSQSGGAKQEETILQREATFDGADRVKQGIKLTIEVEREPTFTGLVPAVAGAVPAAVDALVGARPAPVVLTGDVVRLIPDGLSRTADERPERGMGGPDPVELRDPRPVLMPERFNVEATTAGTLLERVCEELGRSDMLGEDGLARRQDQIEHQLSAIARSAFLQRMTGSEGFDLVRLTDPNDATKAICVRVRARPSELHVVVGGRKNTELGMVNRMQRTGTIASTVGRLWPFNRSAGDSDYDAGVATRVGSGEQASQARSGPFGIRRESSLFERGDAATVRLRMDYDLVMERRTIQPGGGETVDTRRGLRSAAAGTAYVTMFERDLEEIQAQQELGRPGGPATPSAGPDKRTVFDRILRRGTVSPTLTVSLADVEAEARNREGYAEQPHLAVADVLRERGAGRTSAQVRLTAPADTTRPSRPITLARLVARDLGVQVALDVTKTKIIIGQYLAAPTGELRSAVRDGGYTAAYGTLPPELLALTDRHGVPMHEVFADRVVPGPFAERVRARLRSMGVTDLAPPAPLWPGPLKGPGATASVSSSSYGGAASVTSRHIQGTAFVADGRLPGADGVVEDLSPLEIGTAFDDVHKSDFAPAAFGRGSGSWNVEGIGRVGDLVAVVTAKKGPKYFSYRVAEHGELDADVLARTDLDHAGTDDDPYVVSFAPRLATDQVSRVWVHEVTDTLHQLARQEAAAPRHGVVRGALSRLNPFAAPVESRDGCVPARHNEHRFLSRQWLEAAPDSEARARLSHELEGVARELVAHGVPAPAPPDPVNAARLAARASAYDELREQEPRALLSAAEAHLSQLAGEAPARLRDAVDRAYAVPRHELRQLHALTLKAFALRAIADASTGAERLSAAQRLVDTVNLAEPLAREIARGTRAAEKLVGRAHGQSSGGPRWRVLLPWRKSASGKAPALGTPSASAQPAPRRATARQILSSLLTSGVPGLDVRRDLPPVHRSPARRLPPGGGPHRSP